MTLDGDSPSRPPSGTVLSGRYELLDQIGRGGMADVYRASDLRLERFVAVKLMRDSAGDESDHRRFVDEARTLAGLSHSGLVTVLDAGFGKGDQPFLVMELVEGPTIAEATATGPLPVDEVGSIGVQVAEALAYVHDHGVVHRDVKPGNVLLGGENRVKLADFGIARLLDAARHTRTGHLVGTVAYLAPEQVTGDDVTGCADIYSLGLLLLEALTGERQYPGTATEAALARLSRPPRIPEDLPAPWRRLLAEMTALDPSERPSAAEVAAALRSEPTGPIPLATERPTDTVTVPLLARDESPTRVADEMPTRVSTAPPTAVPSSPRSSAIDRAGDALARQPKVLARRVRAMAPHQRGVAAALAALTMLLVVVALLSNAEDPAPTTPDNTPAQLRDPLHELHVAINGEDG